MVTYAASGAVITWRHDGIGTRRLHGPLFKLAATAMAN